MLLHRRQDVAGSGWWRSVIVHTYQTKHCQIICYCADIEAWRNAGGGKQGHNLPNQTLSKYMLQGVEAWREAGGAGRCLGGRAGTRTPPPHPPTLGPAGEPGQHSQARSMPRPRVLLKPPSCFCWI